jgi:hypothetical protein
LKNAIEKEFYQAELARLQRESNPDLLSSEAIADTIDLAAPLLSLTQPF